MGHLILQGDNFTWPGFSLLGETSLALTLDETGTGDVNVLDFLVLSGTTSVSIASTGVGFNSLHQLAEKTNDLTTVTISGSEPFGLGSISADSNAADGVVTDIAATAASPTKIHSSLTLIDASATTGGLAIFAGATNTSSAGVFEMAGTSTSTSRSRTPGSRSRAARVTIPSRTTLRTVSSTMATASIQSPWAEPVQRPPWAPVPTIMFTSGLATWGPMRQPVPPSAIV